MDNSKQCSPLSASQKGDANTTCCTDLITLFHMVNLEEKKKAVTTTTLGKSFPLSRITVKSTDNCAIWFGLKQHI